MTLLTLENLNHKQKVKKISAMYCSMAVFKSLTHLTCMCKMCTFHGIYKGSVTTNAHHKFNILTTEFVNALFIRRL